MVIVAVVVFTTPRTTGSSLTLTSGSPRAWGYRMPPGTPSSTKPLFSTRVVRPAVVTDMAATVEIATAGPREVRK